MSLPVWDFCCLARALTSLGFGLHRVSTRLDCWLQTFTGADLRQVTACLGFAAWQGLLATVGCTLHCVSTCLDCLLLATTWFGLHEVSACLEVLPGGAAALPGLVQVRPCLHLCYRR